MPSTGARSPPCSCWPHYSWYKPECCWPSWPPGHTAGSCSDGCRPIPGPFLPGHVIVKSSVFWKNYWKRLKVCLSFAVASATHCQLPPPESAHWEEHTVMWHCSRAARPGSVAEEQHTDALQRCQESSLNPFLGTRHSARVGWLLVWARAKFQVYHEASFQRNSTVTVGWKCQSVSWMW